MAKIRYRVKSITHLIVDGVDSARFEGAPTRLVEYCDACGGITNFGQCFPKVDSRPLARYLCDCGTSTKNGVQRSSEFRLHLQRKSFSISAS